MTWQPACQRYSILAKMLSRCGGGGWQVGPTCQAAHEIVQGSHRYPMLADRSSGPICTTSKPSTAAMASISAIPQ